MLRDANEAAELNDQYVKAFLAIGEALVEIGKNDVGTCAQIDKGIQRMRKAYSLCTGQKQRELEGYIQKQILKAQKIKFYKQSEIDVDEKAGLLFEIKRLVGENEEQDTVARFQRFLDDDKSDRAIDVPDFLKCPISDEIFEDPVVIESGHTYERAMI